MDHKLTPLRPSLTALTAALVLSATPAFAQTADTAPAPAPVTIAPAAPVLTPAAPVTTAPDTAAAPAPADTTSNMSAQEPVAAPTPAPAAPMATQSPVVVHTTAETSDAAPAAAAPAAKVARTVKVAPAVVAPTPAPTPASTPVAKVAPAPETPAPAPQPEAAPAQPAPAVAATQHDEPALYAGIGGAALLILGGGAFALSRRRKDEDELAYAGEDYVAAEPVIVPVAVEPSYEPAVASVATPITETAPIGESRLPNGFDLSRFGPHTQAAYRGPTEDNPSLSLKKRLKIASFRDGRLRQGLEVDAPTPAEQSVEREAPTRNLLGGKLSDKLSFRPSRPRPSFRPATA